MISVDDAEVESAAMRGRCPWGAHNLSRGDAKWVPVRDIAQLRTTTAIVRQNSSSLEAKL